MLKINIQILLLLNLSNNIKYEIKINEFNSKNFSYYDFYFKCCDK